MLAWRQNAERGHSANRRGVTRPSRITGEKGRTLLIHTAKEPPKQETQAPRPKIVVMEFEGPDYGDWQVTGEAFGKRPAHGTLANQQSVSGFLGSGLVNTYLGGDRPHGTLRSPAMTVTRKYINFLIGGGPRGRDMHQSALVD